MTVSIVMAAQNAEAFIGEAVRSAVEQTYPDWELLVVDDGSTDGTAATAASFGDSRIRVLSVERIGVLSAVRNVGIEAARGEFIALLDADDMWLPSKLERQVELLAEQPTVGVVHTGAELIVDGRRRPAPRSRQSARRPLIERLLANNFIYSSSAVIRRGLLDRHGAFDPDPRQQGSPDYDLWLRLAPYTEFALIDEPLILYRVHGTQMSADHAMMRRSALFALELFEQREPDLVHSHVAAFDAAVGMRRQLAGLPGRGRRELLRSLRRRPWSALTWRWLLRSFLPQRRATLS